MLEKRRQTVLNGTESPCLQMYQLLLELNKKNQLHKTSHDIPVIFLCWEMLKEPSPIDTGDSLEEQKSVENPG